MTYSVNVGDTIPSFKIKDNEGYEVTDDDLVGSPLVIYFYPKDDTPGCTKEACSFRDHIEQFDGLDTLVIGVSPDNGESHEQFSAKYNLNFTLLSDPNLEICRKFDVRKGVMGIERTTFVIDGEGIIRWIERPVTVGGHVERVIQALAAISNSEVS
jgi:peroxiredoxin Q/BCP